MWSSEGKPTDTGASEQRVPNTTPTNHQQKHETPEELLNKHQKIFQLMDNLLSFEACLYHQILPLALENKQLRLGMVYPQDSGALDYVARIVSYLKCTMVTEEIANDTHRSILSAYLNYKNTSQPEVSSDINQPIVEQEQVRSPETPQASEQQADVSTKKETIQENTLLPSDVTVLQLRTPELLTPTEVLVKLPPRKLLEELLGRVLGGGIGRLYLERQPYQGKIIWSDNGILQLTLDNLPLSLFQGVLNELKRFAALPVITLTEPKQVEKECLYQKDRLLIRMRVMSGVYGEEATLQVLRGAALKFYQQQQFARLSRDVLGISQQLSYKLHELHQRLIANPSLKSEQSETLLALNRLVENLDQHIKTLSANDEREREPHI